MTAALENTGSGEREIPQSNKSSFFRLLELEKKKEIGWWSPDCGPFPVTFFKTIHLITSHRRWIKELELVLEPWF